MSMIIICQSSNHLEKYGLKNAYNVGMTKIKEIVKLLRFDDELWSNDVFGCIYDESWNYMNAFKKDKNFSDTSLFYFLDEIIEKCEKIAVFYCEPSVNELTWTTCYSKDRFLTEMETVLKEDDMSRTIIFMNKKENQKSKEDTKA